MDIKSVYGILCYLFLFVKKTLYLKGAFLYLQGNKNCVIYKNIKNEKKAMIPCVPDLLSVIFSCNF